MTKLEFQDLVSNTINNVYKRNSKLFEETEQIETPLATQIAVISVIEILQKEGIFPKFED